MKFKAKLSTADGRLIKGNVYIGQVVYKSPHVLLGSSYGGGLRIAVYDNTGEWMTFDPDVFEICDLIFASEITRDGIGVR